MSSDAVVVAKYLRSRKMLSHPNATPDLLRYLAAIAGEKDDPGAYCAVGIRERWTPSHERVDPHIALRAKRDRLLSHFDRLAENDRAAVVVITRKKFPNLLRYPESDAIVRSAIAQIMAAREVTPT